MGRKIHWTCEACDSPNSLEEGEPLNCRFCRLTYEVKIAPETDPEKTDKLPVEGILEKLRPSPSEKAPEPEPQDLPEGKPEN